MLVMREKDGQEFVCGASICVLGRAKGRTGERGEKKGAFFFRSFEINKQCHACRLWRVQFSIINF